MFSIATATLASVDFNNTTNPSSNITIDPQNDYRVWENTVKVGTRKVTFNRISVRVTGSIDADDLQNFRLYVDGVQKGSAVASIDANKYVTFDLSASPVTLNTGNRVIKVLADIVGGSYKNFIVSLKKTADANFVDSQYGVEVLPTANSATFSARETGTVTISTGTITITRMSDSPSGNVVKDANAALLAKFEIKAAGENVKIETMRVAVNANSSAGSGLTLKDGYLLADGVQVGNTAAILEDSSATGYTEYSTNLVVKPGSPVTLEVYADIYDASSSASLATNDTVRIDIIGGNINNAEGQVSSQIIDAPSGTVIGITLNVVTGTMTLAKYSAYPSKSIVTPVTAYKFGEFTLTGNSTEAVNLTDLTVQFVTATTTADKLTNVYVVYGTKTSSVKATISASSAVLSEELSWAIDYQLAKSASVNVAVYGTVSATIIDGSFQPKIKFTGTTVDSASTVYTNGSTAYVTGQVMTCGTGTFTAAIDSDTPLTQ
ncbi:hypothetical protein CO116_03715, partial [Candidatus Falkowbacteria bacterium CG_4_9_14_3_um_filter_38_19]